MHDTSGSSWTQFLVALATSVVIALLVFGVRQTGLLQRFEHIAYDQYFRLERPEGSDERILIVEVTEQDIRNLGAWPLSDRTLAKLIRTVGQAGASAIGVDIYRDFPVPPGTEELDQTLLATPRVVMVRQMGGGVLQGIPAPAVLRATGQVGFNDVIVDADGIVRRGVLFLDDGVEEVSTSLSLRLALLYLGDRDIFPSGDPMDPTRLRLGPTTIAPLETHDGAYVGVDASGYQFLLDYRGAGRSFASVKLTELLAGEVDPDTIRGKIVIVGLTAQSTNDFFQFPFLRFVAAGLENAGVALHGHMASQLVRYGLGESAPFRILREWQEALCVLAWALLGGSIGLWVRSVGAFVLSTTAGLLLLWLGGYVFFREAWWIPVVPPGLAWIASAGVVTAYMSSQEKAQRAMLMHLFARHVSKDVADEIWRKRKQFLEGGRPRSERLTATILFLDMKGYTSRAEKMDPQELMDWVNEFFGAMAKKVIQHGGVVDDYFGDGMMASFGVPFPRASEDEVCQDAQNAVKCALELEQTLHELNTRWRAHGLPAVATRVGVASGPVVAGSQGPEDRLKYTVVGDIVVTAQRLESLDDSEHDFEKMPCRILITERTSGYLDEGFSRHKIGEFHVKGKDEPVTVYQVTGGEQEASRPVTEVD
jgi:adenylate cyclase